MLEVKSIPLKCSICTDSRVKQVNQAISRYKPMRHIASQILHDERKYRSVCRHMHNCLKFDTQKAIEERTLDSKVEVYKEFKAQLELATKLRAAAQEYLTHPETGEITLIPQSDEIEVMYLDHSDKTASGAPKRKTDSLQVLLDKIESNGECTPGKVAIKHTDIRSFALDAIKTIDGTLDKFAKIEGEYTKDKDNPESIGRFETAVEALISKLDWERDLAETFVREKFPEYVSEMEN